MKMYDVMCEVISATAHWNDYRNWYHGRAKGMWEWQIGNVLWRIPAATYEEAITLLCQCLGVETLPADARFLGGPE